MQMVKIDLKLEMNGLSVFPAAEILFHCVSKQKQKKHAVANTVIA